MKKLLWGLSMLGLLFIFARCTNKVTQEDLKAHDWIFETKEKSEEISAIASFSDKTMTLSLDPSKMKSSAENDWEKIGEEFSKQLLESIKFEVSYTLNNRTIHLKNSSLELDNDYDISKKDKNLILIPKKEDTDKIVLRPYKKTKTQKSSSKAAANIANSSADLSKIIEKFKSEGLIASNPKKMTKEDYGMAPLVAKTGIIFGIQKSDDEKYMNARLYSFSNLEDLRELKAYYDDLGESSAVTFSYTAANEKKKLLMQFNGNLSQDLVQKYVDSAKLTLTPVSFSQSSSSTTNEESETDDSQTANQASRENNETYEEMKQRTLKSVPADRTNWSNQEWEAFGMALFENDLAMDNAGNIISKEEKEKQAASAQQAQSARAINTAEQAVKVAKSVYGDNNGTWTWGSMGEVDNGFFIKATDPNDGTMTHTVKSIIVHFDGTITEN